MNQKVALITGVSGQDGAYLAKLLLSRGYIVYGSSRDAEARRFRNLDRLGIADQIHLESMALNDFRSVIQVLMKVQPDEIYNLAGQSSVGLSFLQPVETLESLAIGVLNLLEGVRLLGRPVRLYNASSSECFGETGEKGADEQTPFRPRSPYAVAKATAFWTVANYRDAYGIYACSGILFNHESPLRPERFVTRKIISSACRISLGSQEKLRLGDLSVKRDWGWSAEYVEAMWRMVQLDAPEDFVIATHESNSLQSFVEEAFNCVGLNAIDHIEQDKSLFRPSEIRVSLGCPDKAASLLGWRPEKRMRQVVRAMVDAELEILSGALKSDNLNLR